MPGPSLCVGPREIRYISFGAYLELFYGYVIYIKIYGMLPLGKKKA